MRVLVVGSGGREHTLIWKLKQSPDVEAIYAAPGNGGISEIAECINIGAHNMLELIYFAKSNQIDLTIVGPEDPLAVGIVDRFQDNDLKIFGPTRSAARIESSKSFAKELMKKYNIPTASFEIFEDSESALNYIKENGAPIVVKADGLAAGKGVIPCRTEKEAEEAVKQIMVDKNFGDAGNKVILEEFLDGEEASILAFSDGSTVIPMASSQDHKRVFEGDRGPNTGGMGAYSPAPVVTEELENDIYCSILVPTIEGLKASGIDYKGILYAGLMITDEGPKVIEYNCRFGDPELQVVLPRLKTDLVKPIQACIDGTLDKVKLDWDSRAAVCVVMASGGYPGSYETGRLIKGLDRTSRMEDINVFHAGTKREGAEYFTSGGRVLGVTALGNDIPSAIDLTYSAVDEIYFENVYYRNDIGHRALKRFESK
jgi:phosphoribosylamine--glycine ligase